ncbi:uncharacterized protein M421DRAFT_354795 [Didymella exigua CBS 183.55]|uniref:Uncharacterized protein n=1 Tax=Didymella exigua CBS 183.55 TaxID=1150837 RepID=A0A6A5R3A1_9PLEO|nr:uncharacterized protein M421DRAFT_354795 [Didymella exigua CBS 183.55]KAF1922531.1 hypothetical protein M421DRAFT_354795 [Didymella exigua CBS 183.55]
MSGQTRGHHDTTSPQLVRPGADRSSSLLLHGRFSDRYASNNRLSMQLLLTPGEDNHVRLDPGRPSLGEVLASLARDTLVLWSKNAPCGQCLACTTQNSNIALSTPKTGQRMPKTGQRTPKTGQRTLTERIATWPTHPAPRHNAVECRLQLCVPAQAAVAAHARRAVLVKASERSSTTGTLRSHCRTRTRTTTRLMRGSGARQIRWCART